MSARRLGIIRWPRKTAHIGLRGKRADNADLAIVQEWLAAWDESTTFSDAAVRHLKSLITDPFCFVVVTLGVGREPRSLVFRRVKRMRPPVPTRRPFSGEAALRELREQIEEFRSMPVGPVAPVAPSVGQLWHQTGVESATVPKLARVLRWDGAEWVVAGLVVDDPEIGKQGKQVCNFMEELTYAHNHSHVSLSGSIANSSTPTMDRPGETRRQSITFPTARRHP